MSLLLLGAAPGLHSQASCRSRLRRTQPFQCSQGFGKADEGTGKGGKGSRKKGASVKGGDAKAVDQAVKLVEERKANPLARPVDSREATRGRVEFVKVKNWGSGEPGDLGQLQVEAASGVQVDSAAPLYEQLAKRLELLEAQGAMPVAQPKGSKPLPPFQRWAFAEEHYLQFLCDLLSVYSALEAALEACTRGGEAALLPGNIQQVAQLLGPDLYRSQQLAADVQRLVATSGSPAQSGGSSGGGGERNAELGGRNGGGDMPAPLPASPNAAGLAQYLSTLASRFHAAETPQEASSAALKVLAHAYVLLLVILTSGGRVGAAAAEKLNLFERGALNTYRTYPPHVTDPVVVLKDAVNRWGELLSEGEREQLMEELPGAMQKASLLLTALAQE